ncbi:MULTISPECIES: DUF1846 domain-containing protein [unclassified Fusibacter]|uniref:DUF1846 domain-containing protein n=1 Tax=unclassified Fusibacter TaxID=2624464 RepID=UPI001011AB49|nr:MULTISPECIES: DUF1846 domain-containing protein [unclassified Fusibacter]MCK8060764.1 DUF1846 domain-containing protein [Fusibacter sp. A2]NPE23060.1 DUF1846 domain-containing protein [Fusibacter sp. A1]RXV59732.1 DUF1846 domain-containing protein [Fusibacter sp. A1]
MKKGFDSEKYLEEQSKYILERVNNFDKLYLEFGGKMIFDMHAKRVLPGFDENAKIKLLNKLKDKLEVIVCVYAGDIERNKMRGDFGISYDIDVLKLIDDLRNNDLEINSVVITRFDNQPATTAFINKLEHKGIKVYKHTATKGYPTDVDTIVSDEGYGKNEYVETTKPIVVVTAPGPGSGKLATCLTQLYHEYKMGNSVGYSKFETFPVWNMPLKHPLNIAYEAATVDLKDVNMVDSFHLEAYGEVTVNYNRDIETFPVLKRIIEKITGTDSMYQSPTDMGVNRIAFGITDDEAIKEASRQEIIRRYFKTGCEYKKGQCDIDTFNRSKMIMEELQLKPTHRVVVEPARAYAEQLAIKYDTDTAVPVVALELNNGEIVTGKNGQAMDAAAACVINALKKHAGISDDVHLLSPAILNPIIKLKTESLGDKRSLLSLEEVLIALSISAAFNPMAQVALDHLSDLRGCETHATVILHANNEATLRNLGIELTCDAQFASSSLFYGN